MRHIRLIATRELQENLRTKGFWLTALSPPLIAFVVAGLLLVARVNETQLRFAVIDHSGWLADAVRERNTIAELDDFLDGLARGEHAELPARLAELPTLAKRLTKTQRRALVRAGRDEMTRDGTATKNAPLMPPTQSDQAISAPPWSAQLPWQLHRWWRHTNAEELPDWLTETGRSRFHWLGDDDPDLNQHNETQLRAAVQAQQLFGFFVVPADPIHSDEPLRFVSRNLTNADLPMWFRAKVEATLRERRLLDQRVSLATLAWANRPLDLQASALVGSESKLVTRREVIAQWAPGLLAYVLWISVISMSQMLLTTTVEEKSSRLADLLLATVTADDLLAGKVLGVALTGLMVLALWGGMAAATGALLADRGALQLTDFAALAAPVYWLSFIVYFLLGYLLLATIIAGLGALTNSLRDAQNLIFPVQMLLMVPLASIVPVSRNPEGVLASFLTWIPPFTPFVMMNRAAQAPPWWVYAGSTLLLVATIWSAWRIASRLFSAGMLMSGGSPRLRELPALLRK